jgi:hypothetical protein
MSAAHNHWNSRLMTVLLLEALAALALFVFAVWWTMFSGRRKGELPPEQADAETQGQPEHTDTRTSE